MGSEVFDAFEQATLTRLEESQKKEGCCRGEICSGRDSSSSYSTSEGTCPTLTACLIR